MAGVDWEALNRDAERIAFANKARAAEASAPTRVELGGGELPPYQPPVLLNAAQEQQAANQVAAQTPQVAPAAPTVMQQPMPQPGMIPLQQTVTSQQLPPALIKQQGEILAKQQAAAQSEADAIVAQNKALAEQAKSTALELAAQNQRQATQQAYDNEQRDAAMAQVQKAVDDFNANKTVNPNRFNERIGVGGRILATIGQAFGAFGAAITHSPNYAQQMIERAVDADIRSQEQEIQARGQAVNMANNQFAMFRQKGLDNQAALAATKVNMLQEAQAKVDEITANTKNPIVLAKAQEVKAGLAQTALNTLMNHAQTSVSTVKANAAAAGPKSVEDQLKLRALEVDVPQKDPKTGKDAGTKTYMAKSAQDAEKVRDALSVRSSLHADLAEMKSMIGKSSQSISPAAKALVAKKYNTIKTKLGVMYKLGALAEADLDLVSQIGDPTSFFQRDSTSAALIDQLDKSLDTSVESELRGRGMIR